ncbi:protein FAM173B-like [Tropilaelaps mercedesae]|uniref:Protein FAM173B-like n=1 Tax=Tropilaelaps mercedesae TaxID=418985 RepID=A0A1V9XDQ1_9ACAR|nr:protein FAM173B-like [Tropilaelaps mercedesae]
MVICGPFVLPAFRKICLPYVPATSTQASSDLDKLNRVSHFQISNVLNALKGRRCKSIVDLGSGDGRIVTTLAERGSEFVGVELNPWLVLYSKMTSLRKFGINSGVRFRRCDLWVYPLQQHDTIVIFGVECMMKELQLKCERELQQGSAVVACRFPFEAWKPKKVFGQGTDTIWLYER